MAQIIKNDKKTINGWAMYDWANSVYSLVITSAIFPIYYYAVAGKTVNILGAELSSSVAYTWALSLSFIIISILSPLLSGIADYGGKKKMFMQIFCYLGASSCSLMYFYEDGSQTNMALVLFILASIGFSGSLVFYNAYLPEITTEDRFDKVSAKGFTMGYVGSVILLVVNLVVIEFNEPLGISKGFATRLAFLTVGVWWVGFAQITFSRLPSNVFKKKVEGKLFRKGFQELKFVLKQLKHLPLLKKYLLSFFFYNMGVQTVMLLATSFGVKELSMESGELIIVVLLVQLVAIPGAYLFSIVSQRRGNIYSLAIMIVIWVLICVASYFIQSSTQFFILAALVGLVMGGIQSLSRSTYAKFIPQETEDHASYFSFYDVTEKISIVIGTGLYGLLDDLTGSMRISSLGLTGFFIIGLILLLRLPSKSSYQTTLKA